MELPDITRAGLPPAGARQLFLTHQKFHLAPLSGFPEPALIDFVSFFMQFAHQEINDWRSVERQHLAKDQSSNDGYADDSERWRPPNQMMAPPITE